MLLAPDSALKERTLQELALMVTVHCVRNTVIETYHAEGKLSDPEMKAFNVEVANRLYTVLVALLDSEYSEDRDEYIHRLRGGLPHDWDTPVFDDGLAWTLIALKRQTKGNSASTIPLRRSARSTGSISPTPIRLRLRS
jgi:hypothetical protein